MFFKSIIFAYKKQGTYKCQNDLQFDETHGQVHLSKWSLLNARLSCIPTYAMSMYMLSRTIIKRMDSARKRFFWQGSKKRYYLVKWAVIVRQKKGSRSARFKKNEYQLIV
jgi:hypothetical protein